MARHRRERLRKLRPFPAGDAPRDTKGQSYWAPLDGVRGFAVVAVVLFHTGWHTFRDGFLGVDVFFVLSGFLITSLLLRGFRSPGRGLGLSDFYLRRALRILPALVAVCLGVVALAAVASAHFKQVAEGALATLGMFANIWMYTGHNTYLLQQMWTLSIEEQFYLLAPLVIALAFLAPRPARVAIFATCSALWAALILVHLPFEADQVRESYLRASGLALGCLLAFALPWVKRWVPAVALKVLCVAAAAFLVVCAVAPVLSGSYFDKGAVSLASIAALPLVAGLVLAPPKLLDQALSNPFAKWLGGRSYAIYLWHFPLLSLAINHARHVPFGARVVGALLVTVVAAELSWRLVEERFIRRKLRHEPQVAG